MAITIVATAGWLIGSSIVALTGIAGAEFSMHYTIGGTAGIWLRHFIGDM